MKMKEYQGAVAPSPARPDLGIVADRVRRLGRILRAVAQDAAVLGYSLEEIASINIEDEGTEA